MFNLRGIAIRRDGGDKYIKVIVQVGFADIYKMITKKANIPIDKEVILAYIESRYGIARENINWPHHIEVHDI